MFCILKKKKKKKNNQPSDLTIWDCQGRTDDCPPFVMPLHWRGQESSRFYIPPVLLFLLYFLLECLSLIISVFEGNRDHINFANGNKQQRGKDKSVLWNAELAASLETQGVLFSAWN